MFALQTLMAALGSSNLDCRQDGAKLDPALGRASYIFNATVRGIEDADAVLIVGSNPRKESPVLNARIRKRWLRGDCPVGVVGEQHDLTYPYSYLGAGPDTLAKLPSEFAERFGKAERPLVIVGQGALARDDGAAVLATAAKLAGSMGLATGSWRGLSVLHTAAARVGGLDLGFVPGAGGLDAAAMAKSGALDVLFLLGADEIAIEPGAFVRLPRHQRRSRRGTGRCRPARRDLHGKVRHLRQHRRPGAVGRTGQLSARRCPRGLGHPARAVRRARPPPAVRLARATQAEALRGAPAHGALR